MAKKPSAVSQGDFQILYPPANGDGLVDAQGNVEVIVLNVNDIPPFQATILFSQGGAVISGPQDLQNILGTNLYSGRMAVGPFVDPPPGQMNRYVSVTSDGGNGNTHGQPFRAVHAGSGSGSGAGQNTAGAAALSEVFPQGRPVPVALSAQFGAPGPGGPQNQAATLVYSGAAGFERCWFSQPIALGSDEEDPAVWMLERPDARTWALRLRRGDRDLVVYRHTTAVEKDGPLPVRLQIDGNGNGRHADWPPTVTISPAP